MPDEIRTTILTPDDAHRLMPGQTYVPLMVPDHTSPTGWRQTYHLALLIGADHPPYAVTHEGALEHYRQNHDGYEAWCCWRTIMELRDAIGR